MCARTCARVPGRPLALADVLSCPGTRPGTPPGTHPCTRPCTLPCTLPCTRPGRRPCTRPGTRPCTRPGTHPCTRQDRRATRPWPFREPRAHGRSAGLPSMAVPRAESPWQVMSCHAMPRPVLSCPTACPSCPVLSDGLPGPRADVLARIRAQVLALRPNVNISKDQ